MKDNLATRTGERESGIAEAELTSSQYWSAYSLNKEWNAGKEVAAPWWPEVSMHAFRSGVVAAAAGLENYRSSKKGTRNGRPVGFPRFKSRDRSKPSVTFTESTSRLAKKVADDTATIQKVTISHVGGRWQESALERYLIRYHVGQCFHKWFSQWCVLQHQASPAPRPSECPRPSRKPSSPYRQPKTSPGYDRRRKTLTRGQRRPECPRVLRYWPCA